MIHKSDKEVLAKLFNPGQVSYSVLDGERLQRTLMSEQAMDTKPNNRTLVFVDNGDCEVLNQDFDICIHPTSKNVKGKFNKRFRYITNPDGTMRWIFPEDLKYPSFLSFYSVTTLKAKLFVAILKLIFAFRLQRFFIRGLFTVVSRKELAFDKIAKKINTTSYSIFTGTVGKNRKGILEFHQGKDLKYFFKLPFDVHSAGIVEQERHVLTQLAQCDIHHFKYPRIPIDTLEVPGLLQENIALGKVQRVRHIDARHLQFIEELYRHKTDFCTPGKCAFMSDVKGYLEAIESHDDIFLSRDILPKLQHLYQQLLAKESLTVAWAHGDFVPWNTFATPDKLQVYDWELSRNYYPALFDVFHFVFQSGILIDRASLSDIYKALTEVYELPEFKRIKEQLHLDVQTQLEAYLLLNISHYLSIYMEQGHLHKQVYWLLNTWNEALDQVVTVKGDKMLHRFSFIRNIICYLNEQEIEYAVLKIANKDLFNLDPSSDIDLLFNKDQVNVFIDHLKQFSYLQRMNVSKRSNLVTIELFMRDGSFLSLDLVLAFKRRSFVYLDASALMERRVLDSRGFYRLMYNDDLDYMLNFYVLNGDVVPAHYRDYFLALPEEVQKDLTRYLSDSLEVKFDDFNEIFEQSKLLRVNIKQTNKRLKQNKGLRRLRNQVQYLNDTYKMIRFSKGFMLTLSGVDGAGKTTLLERTQEYLEKTLRRQVVMLRLRPSVLPILSAYKYGKEEAEKRSMDRLPRTGTNSSVPKSILRFMYYYLDYMLGQWLVYFKHTMRGKVVIYDRYYFDFINDPRRMNLELPQWITKLGYKFIFKPRLNLFLYAQPEVILARKKELDGETIKELNERYLSNFNAYGKRYRRSEYVCIENEVLEDTEKIIKDYINAIA